MNLIEGEHIDWTVRIGKDDESVTEEIINEKYSKGEIRIVTEQARYPLNTIVTLLRSGNYLLHPDFQRRHRWDAQKKSKLIESFVINVPIPPIFLYETSYSKYDIMDGLQRLTAISEFYEDRFTLEGLEEWPELNGYCYSRLPETIKLGIDRRYLSSIILLQETAKSKEDALRMKRLVFERLNNGGIDLSYQETRNAIYDGAFNQACIRMSQNPYFRKMWRIPLDVDKKNTKSDNEIYSKMEDVELVLRFFAFRQIESWHNNVQKSLFDTYLYKANDFSDSTISGLESIFSETIELLYSIFGIQAFCLWRRKKRNSTELHINNNPSKVLYDPLMLVFCQYLNKKDIIVEKKEEIKTEIKHLFETNYSLFNSRFNKSDIVNRINEISYLLKKSLGE